MLLLFAILPVAQDGSGSVSSPLDPEPDSLVNVVINAQDHMYQRRTANGLTKVSEKPICDRDSQ